MGLVWPGEADGPGMVLLKWNGAKALKPYGRSAPLFAPLLGVRFEGGRCAAMCLCSVEKLLAMINKT